MNSYDSLVSGFRNLGSRQKFLLLVDHIYPYIPKVDDNAWQAGGTQKEFAQCAIKRDCVCTT